MTQVSIKDQIKKLVELQKIDGEIFNFKKDLQEKPLVVKELQEQFESGKTKLKDLEEKFKATLLRRKDFELDLKTREADTVKAKAVLSQIKTNKEYTAKLSEIEHIKADQSVIEDKILNSFEESDSINNEIIKEKGVVSELEKKFLTEKKKIEDEVKDIEDRIKILDSQRKEITPEIDKTYLNRYEKILNHKDGIGIAPVRGMACGGCYMNVTHQTINEIKMHGQLIECEICSRILYLEDDL